MTLGGPPEAFGLPPAKRESATISEELYLEMARMLGALKKRVEVLEERVGITKKREEPCPFCNVLGAHQPWCESDANRTSGTREVPR